MGRIGHWNPGTQSVNEPPSSLDSYIEQMQTELEEDKMTEAKSLSWIETYQQQIDQAWGAIAREKVKLSEVQGRIAETEEFIANSTEEFNALHDEKASLLVELEMAKFEDLNEEKVKTLETRIREINNRL